MEARADLRPNVTLLLFNNMTPLTKRQLGQLKPHFEAALAAEGENFEIQGATPVVQILQMEGGFRFGFFGVSLETLAKVRNVFDAKIAKSWMVNEAPQRFPQDIAIHHQVLQVRADESTLTLDVRFTKLGPQVGFEAFMKRFC